MADSDKMTNSTRMKWNEESILSDFQKRLSDEIHDSNTYLDMAKDMKSHEDPDSRMIRGLVLMGEDEFTHARFIYENLTENGVSVSPELKTDYMALETRVGRLFRRAKRM